MQPEACSSRLTPGGACGICGGRSVTTVMTLKPDYVVNSRYFMANLLRPGSPFLKEYDEIARGRPVYGEPILIYERR